MEAKKSLSFSGIRAVGRQARSAVAVATALSRLPFKHIELTKYELRQSCHALLQKCEFKDVEVGYKTTKAEGCVVN